MGEIWMESPKMERVGRLGGFATKCESFKNGGIENV